MACLLQLRGKFIPYGPAIAATAADILGRAIVTPPCNTNSCHNEPPPKPSSSRYRRLHRSASWATRRLLQPCCCSRESEPGSRPHSCRLCSTSLTARQPPRPARQSSRPNPVALTRTRTLLPHNPLPNLNPNQALLRGVAQYMGTLSCMWAAGGLIVGFLYDTGALDTPHLASAPSCHLHAPT